MIETDEFVASVKGRRAERCGYLDEALTLYRAYLARNPEPGEGWLDLAAVELDLDDAAAAKKSFSRAGGAAKSIWGRWLQARIFHKLGHNDKALAILNALIASGEGSLTSMCETRATVEAALDMPAEALVDSIRSTVFRHGFVWCSSLIGLMSGACRSMMQELGVRLEIVTKLEDNLVHECYMRTGIYFRERGELHDHPGEVRIGFMAAFSPQQTAFLARLLPLLQKQIAGLKVYAYGTQSLAASGAPHELSRLVEWRGIAGKLTYMGYGAIKPDGLDLLCDMDWGSAEARTDIAMMNPAAIRMLWLPSGGRCRVTVPGSPTIDQDLAAEKEEWAVLAQMAQSGRAAWTDAGASQDCARHFAALVSSAIKEAGKSHLFPRYAAGGTPPPMQQIDAKRKDLATADVHRVTNNFFANWLNDVRRLNFHFDSESRSDNLRVAVLTPYIQGQTEQLEFSRQSLLEQTGKIACRQFLIGQGYFDPAIADWDAESIVMPNDPDDLGLSALAVGARAALRQGYNAIAFLPPGVRWRGAHLRDLVMASVRRGSDLTMSRVALVGTHGRIFAEHVSVGNIPVHHNSFISSFLITGRALKLMPLWASIPYAARFYATGIFRSAVRTRGLRQFMIPNATVEVRALDLFSFRRFSNFTPPSALPMNFKEMALIQPQGEWQEWLAMLALSNTNLAAPENRAGILFDAVEMLTGKQETAAPQAVEKWAAGLPDSSVLLPCDPAACAQRLQAIGRAETTLTLAAHREKAGLWRTAKGGVYPLDGIIATLAEQGLALESWRQGAVSPDGIAALYTMHLRPTDNRSASPSPSPQAETLAA
ncbi:MAG: tetratricopeptide repeat protein [Alphaproteobacteria bacterium]|nr:tetratricopeptide repeat protein [Alphaproteobacteria bacterium]